MVIMSIYDNNENNDLIKIAPRISEDATKSISDTAVTSGGGSLTGIRPSDAVNNAATDSGSFPKNNFDKTQWDKGPGGIMIAKNSTTEMPQRAQIKPGGGFIQVLENDAVPPAVTTPGPNAGYMENANISMRQPVNPDGAPGYNPNSFGKTNMSEGAQYQPPISPLTNDISAEKTVEPQTITPDMIKHLPQAIKDGTRMNPWSQADMQRMYEGQKMRDAVQAGEEERRQQNEREVAEDAAKKRSALKALQDLEKNSFRRY